MTPTKSTSGQAAYTDMTDAALNRRVAERLGWRLEATAFPNLYATVINPDGYRTGTVKLASDGISHALVDGKWWDSWATSIDAAAALDFGGWTLTIIRYPHGVVEALAAPPLMPGVTLPQQVRAARTDMARAICEVWLMVQDVIAVDTDKNS